jgi:DUF4097 and DUF4098 domain-containing protein YvlB
MRRKNYSIIITLLLFISISVYASGYQKKDVIKKQFDFPAHGSLKLHNRNGNIIIHSWDKQSIDMEAVKWVRSTNTRRAEHFFSKLNVKIEKGPGMLSIVVEYPKKEFESRWGPDIEFKVDFELYVPREINLDIYSRNGEIDIEDIAGKARVNSRNGNINLNSVDGDMDIYSRNGKIKMADIYGALEVETRNDDVTVDFRQVPLKDRVEISSRNGEIKIKFPQDFSAEISIETDSGEIKTHFPIMISGRIKKGLLQGKVNNGGVPVKISTRNGDIELFTY